MKALIAIALTLSLAVSAAERPSAPPLVPMSDAPIEEAVPGYARWWTWAILGGGVVTTIAGVLILASVVLPLFNPRYPSAGSPR